MNDFSSLSLFFLNSNNGLGSTVPVALVFIVLPRVFAHAVWEVCRVLGKGVKAGNSRRSKEIKEISGMNNRKRLDESQRDLKTVEREANGEVETTVVCERTFLIVGRDGSNTNGD